MARKKPKDIRKQNSGMFQPGNQVAKGNPGPWSTGRPITSAIIQKLNEVDGKTGREVIWDLVDELFEQALPSYDVVRDADGLAVKDENGKPMMVRIPGDLEAIKEIINRSDGRHKSQDAGALAIDGPGGRVVLSFEPDDEKV